MYQKILLSILSMMLLHGCSGGLHGNYFKKSANNKWIDAKGFEGGKRSHLYNKKYIALAKKNIMSDDIEEDEEDLPETMSAAQRNRQMYLKMIERDAANKRKPSKRFDEYQSTFNNGSNDANTYPSLVDISKLSDKDTEQSALQQELIQIKAMLSDAKKDMVKYKCPMETKGSRDVVAQSTEQPKKDRNNNIVKARLQVVDDNSDIVTSKKQNAEQAQETFARPSAI